MAKREMTLVYYHVPEDQDDPETPNVFGIMMPKQAVRLQHLYDNFPLKGAYVFRFKVMYDSTVAWLDLPDLEAKLPAYKDRITVKATRISWDSNPTNPYGHYRFVKGQAQGQAPAQGFGLTQPQPQPQPTQSRPKSSE